MYDFVDTTEYSSGAGTLPAEALSINGKYIEQYDLYDKSGNELIVKIPVVKGEYSSMMNIIFLIGIMGIAFYCCIILIYYLTSKMKWLSDWTIR